MKSLEHLMPKSLPAWIMWITLAGITLYGYYNVGPYQQLDAYYENARWASCQLDPETCQAYSTVDDWTVSIRAPKYVADFIESQVEIEVENHADKPRSTVVTMIAEVEDGRCYVHVDDKRQNALTFADVIRHSKAISSFRIRVSGGQNEMPVELGFRLDDKSFEPVNLVNPTFHRWYTLWLSIVKMLLLPPGSNVFVPLIAMLVVVGGAWVWKRFRKIDDREPSDEIRVRLKFERGLLTAVEQPSQQNEDEQ